ncbi:MAG: exosome complex protein Rrp42 [Candidatus Woesearchaeota archaeon]|nr:exosome complex protein Rrp42 [Candidatus Woesearchaeota archaeon]
MISDEQKKHLVESLNKGIRYDKRKFDEYRNIEVEYGISKSAEGSARVKIGNTDVMVGVKLGIDKPYPDTPTEGCLMVEAELLPLSSPEFEAGPPDIKAIELARVVDRGVREAKAIDMKKLCIQEGEKVWIVFIDICTINDDGNLLDAAGIAAIAALKNAKFPEYNGIEINYKKHTEQSLPLTKYPMPVTVYKIGNNFIVDPTLVEEKAFDARLTVTFAEDKICALQKGGESPLTLDDISKMIDIAARKAEDLQKIITK